MSDMSIGVISTPRTSPTPGTSFVEWGAVLAGGAMAAALSFVLLSFGSAIGLSFVSPWNTTASSLAMIGSLAIFWTMAQQIGAGMVGGYVAGRMRSRLGDAPSHEVEFRDGLHGGLVWAVSIIITVALTLSVAGAVTRAGTQFASPGAAASIARSDPNAYEIDVLLRPTGKDAPAFAVANAELRNEVSRLYAVSIAKGALSDIDRDYLAGIVSQRTGLAQPEAVKRVTDSFATANTSAKDLADKARRAGILTGFVTALSLLVAFAASWWAAQKGGHHRDNAIPARFVFSEVRRAAL